MAMPPDIDSFKLFSEITAVPRPHRLVPFPRVNPKTGETFEIAMWLLTQQESTIIAAEAEKTTRRILKENLANKGENATGYDNVYNNASAIELLFRCCRDPNDITRPLFPSKQAIGDALSSDEVAILLNHYFTLQVELGPIVGAMTSEEMEAWIKKLAEGGSSSQYFLNSFTWEALKGLLIAMVSQLSSLQTDKSLPTSAPEEITSEPKKAKTKK